DVDVLGGVRFAAQERPQFGRGTGLGGASGGLRLGLEPVERVLGVLGALFAVEGGLDALVEVVEFGVQRVPGALLLGAEVAVLLGCAVGDFLGLVPDVEAPFAQPLDDVAHLRRPFGWFWVTARGGWRP